MEIPDFVNVVEKEGRQVELGQLDEGERMKLARQARRLPLEALGFQVEEAED